jgi:hypothetical protein
MRDLPGAQLSILRPKHAIRSCSDLVMDYGPVVVADNVYSEFLSKLHIIRHRLTTMSSLFSSKGSLSTPSGLSLSLLTKVPFDDFKSLI